MKFTKDDAYKELVSQIPEKGQTLYITDRSINEMLDNLMPLCANEETELADFVKAVLPSFKSADKGSRHKASEEVKAYIEKNPPAPPQKDDKDKETPKADDVSAELLKRIEELEKKNADNEKKSTLSKRRSDIATKMAEKGCKDNEWIDDLLGEVNLDGDDFDADARVEKYMKMYNKSKAKVSPSVTPSSAGGGSGNDTYLDSIIKAAAAKNKSDVAQ